VSANLFIKSMNKKRYITFLKSNSEIIQLGNHNLEPLTRIHLYYEREI